MVAPIVSAATGVMYPVLSKLAKLMGDEYKKLKGVRKEASFLEKELRAMNAALERLELMDKPLNGETKDWRDRVREMTYDMENCIDDFMHELEDTNAKPNFVKNSAQNLQSLWRRHKIADRIAELKDLALEAKERRLRYKIDDCISSSSSVTAVDPRALAIYTTAAKLVGIDGPREELVSWLTDADEVRQLKVMSIVGFGGLGKTTLAKQVYDEIIGQFSCKAFVSVSRKADMKSLLRHLQYKLGISESSERRAMQVDIGGSREVEIIIESLKEHLKDKRYLIVVDDLWEVKDWDTIISAFPEDDKGSRVIVTTRIGDVAHYVCCDHHGYIYEMKPLQEQDSRRLFFNRVFGSEDGCPAQFKQISAEILKKCGGLPLAIITIASLLASPKERSIKEWESIRDSLGAKNTLEKVRSILNLSYMHLPLHLRACFLYLGMYPEDHEIDRDRLVRQWIAEGFVNHLHGSDLDNIGKSYFKELIDRSLILPQHVVREDVHTCRVHDMIRDLIVAKCTEYNFVSVAHDYEDMTIPHEHTYKVRRLSLKPSAGGATSGTITADLSQVRSFALFRESEYTPTLSRFKYLRVLNIELAYSSDGDMLLDLSSIGQLFQLRYLSVTGVIKSQVRLPAKIQGLVNLETVTIQMGQVQSFPSDIVVLLPRLYHLFLPFDIGLPEGIGNMKSLRSLDCSGMRKSSLEDIKGLGELTNLTDLSLSDIFGRETMVGAKVGALVSSIGKLRNLRYVVLNCHNEDEHDSMYSLSDPPPRIEELHFQTWQLKEVPGWIGKLARLCSLSLHVKHLSTNEVHFIGKLPSLKKLDLAMLHIPENKAAIICRGLFLDLEWLRLWSNDDVTACMEFEAGAMPNLRELRLVFWGKWGGATPTGMEHLLGLQQIHVHKTTSNDRTTADSWSAFSAAAHAHPSRPTVTFT